MNQRPETRNQQPGTKKASMPRRLHIDMRPAILQHHLLVNGEHLQVHRFCGAMKQDPCRPLCGFWSLVVALLLPSLPMCSFQAIAAKLMRSPPWTPSFANSGIFCCINPSALLGFHWRPFLTRNGLGFGLMVQPLHFQENSELLGVVWGTVPLVFRAALAPLALALALALLLALTLALALG